MDLPANSDDVQRVFILFGTADRVRFSVNRDSLTRPRVNFVEPPPAALRMIRRIEPHPKGKIFSVAS